MQGNNKDWNSADTINSKPANAVNSNLYIETGWHYQLHFLSPKFALNEQQQQQNQEKNTKKTQYSTDVVVALFE